MGTYNILKYKHQEQFAVSIRPSQLHTYLDSCFRCHTTIVKGPRVMCCIWPEIPKNVPIALLVLADIYLLLFGNSWLS